MSTNAAGGPQSPEAGEPGAPGAPDPPRAGAAGAAASATPPAAEDGGDVSDIDDEEHASDGSSAMNEWLECEGVEGQEELDRLTGPPAAALEQLRISACADLSRLPALGCLRALTLVDCGGLAAPPAALPRLAALERLWLWRCPDLADLGGGGSGDSEGDGGGGGGALPASLRVLWVYSCAALPSLGRAAARLPALAALRISDCGALHSLGDGDAGSGGSGGGGEGSSGRGGGSELPSSLERLYIERAPLRRLPADTAALARLQSLQLVRCPALEALPDGIAFLPALMRLVVSRCPKLTSLGAPQPAGPDSSGGAAAPPPFPALEVLCLQGLPGLAALGPALGAGGACPRLKDLFLEDLAALTLETPPAAAEAVEAAAAAAGLGLFASLRRRLLLKNCPGVEARLGDVIGALGRLQKLLALEDCGTLAALPPRLARLSRLEALGVTGCGALRALGPALPPALASLGVSGCAALRALDLPPPPGGLPALASLAVSDCEQLASLPESLAGAAALERLTVSRCPRLASLPAAALAALPRLCTVSISGAALPGAGDGGVWLSTRKGVQEFMASLNA
ncbi:MAG: hypothetical protein J3K34DRAFT_505564 [Monoraphidium minutum]|nr:MAG: hypothetical protein J3K34DRAFT_505564 [Monoraphidium minutum]